MILQRVAVNEGHHQVVGPPFLKEIGDAADCGVLDGCHRARLTSGQLTTYFYGFTELMKLRATLEKTPGFRERAYHDKLLGFGSPSIRHIRTLMTKGGV